MSHAYRMLLGFHIIVATMALVTFWGAALARKGGAFHRRCGYGFAVTMAITAVTAMPLCLLLLIDPVAARPPNPNAADSVEYARVLRLVGGGLLEVSLVTVALLQFGLRALRRRRSFSPSERAFDLTLAGAAITAGALLLGLGLCGFPYFGGRGIAVGLVGILQRRTLLRFIPSRSPWIGQHLVGVMGAGAVAHGSLAVNIARHFTNDVGLMFLPAAPTVLLFAIAIRWLSGRWRRQLNGALPPQPVTSDQPVTMPALAVQVHVGGV